MWSAWSIFGLLMIISQRYIVPYWKIRSWIHRISGILITSITLSLGIAGLYYMSWKIDPGPHGKLGITVVSCVAVFAFAGFTARRV